MLDKLNIIGTDIAAWVFVLGVLIFIHELGHHLVAKCCGVRVEVFSLGFGKRIWGFKWGETDYRISILPFGGYVKMAGENPMEQTTGDPGEFTAHPRWQRFLIAIAGPAMNIALAIVIYTGIFMVHYEYPWFLDKPAQISMVVKDGAADHAGLKDGDLITSIDDVNNPKWEDVFLKTAFSVHQPVKITVQRGAETLQKTATPEPVGEEEIGSLAIVPKEPIIVTLISENDPLDKSGIKLGDEILALNGIPVDSEARIREAIQVNKEKPIQVNYRRDGKEQTTIVTPAPRTLNGKNDYFIGFRSDPTEVIKLPFGAAFTRTLEKTKKDSFLMLDLIKKMVQRKVSMKSVDGPIGIGRVAGKAAREKGWIPLFAIMGLISLNLGVVNLLPIPILDGGLIVMLFIEGLMRRDINQDVKERIYQTAFVCLMLFIAVVLFNDISKMNLMK